MTALLAFAAALAVPALAFTPLERAFAARRQALLRREWMTDFAFLLGQYWVCAGAVIASLSAFSALVAPHLTRLQIAVAAQPFWLQACEAVLLGDLLIYWAHRLSHRYDVLWRFHRVHHTAEHLDWLAAYREHPLDGLFTQFWINLPGILMGFPIELIAGVAAFRGMWAVFIHSNVRLPLGWLGIVLGSPELHHWHHDREHGGHSNYANLNPLMDILFGTYQRPLRRPEFGVNESVPRGYLAQLMYPLVPARVAQRVAKQWQRTLRMRPATRRAPRRT